MNRVITSRDSGIFFITLNDGSNGNRLDREIINEILRGLGEAETDDSVRAVMIRSTSAVFSFGMNLDLAAVNSGNGYEAEEGVKSYGEMLRRIHALAKPVFALVEGEVKAGGVGIVCACDAVLAAETASFELGEVLFGLIPANVLPYLLLRITPQKARYLMLTAKKVDAAEARTIGLADEVFPVQVIEKSVRKILKNVCRSSPDALAEGKRFTARLLDIPFPEQLDPAVNQLIKMLKNNDIREGIRSFQSGNLPPWFGKFSPKNPISLQMEEKE